MDTIYATMRPVRGRGLAVRLVSASYDFTAWFGDLGIQVSGLVPNPRGECRNLHCCHSWRFVRRSDTWKHLMFHSLLSVSQSLIPGAQLCAPFRISLKFYLRYFVQRSDPRICPSSTGQPKAIGPFRSWSQRLLCCRWLVYAEAQLFMFQKRCHFKDYHRQGKDAVMLVKEWVTSPGLSQPPMVVLPGAYLSRVQVWNLSVQQRQKLPQRSVDVLLGTQLAL